MDDRQLETMLEEQAGSAGPISPELQARIAGSLTDSLRPVKPVSSVIVSLLQIAAVFAIFAVALVAVMGTAGLARMSAVQLGVIAALIVAGAGLFSLSLAWQMRPGSYQFLRPAGILGIFGVGLLTGMALLFPWVSPQAFVIQGWHCLASGLAVAAPAALLVWLVVRRGAPLSMSAWGATLGATAGLLGVTVLEFQCPHQEALHLLVWHGSVLIITTAAGIVIARTAVRFFRRRA